MTHFLSILDLHEETITQLVDKGMELIKNDYKGYKPLADCQVGIFFKRSSTRTRSAFSVGALRLGASIVTYGPNDLQITTGETLGDTARVLSSYLAALVVRTNGPMQEMREMAQQTDMPIINAMSDGEHPTQVIGDLITIREHFGRLDGVHVLYLGEGNNTAASLACAVGLSTGMKLTLLTPEGYGLGDELLAKAQQLAGQRGSEVEQIHDLAAMPTGVDAVYTTRWETMGVQHPDPNWRDHFRPYKVTRELMARASKPQGTVFMHDLPAIRGVDVDDEVLDGPQSIAFRQATHKMTSAMAILDYCIKKS
jgi:ornithine carbamoyltransferase